MPAFTRIVVGYENTARGVDAARQAIALARWSGGEVILAHVGADRHEVARMCERLSGNGVPVTWASVGGAVADGLVTIARGQDADLIVVGTHGRAGLRRVLLGSVAESLVRTTGASLLAMRGEPVASGYQRIVVGTDFSPYSIAALSRALALGRDTAVVQVVHGWAPPPNEDPSVRADQRQLRAEVAEERGRALLAAHADETRLRFAAFEGSATRVICEVASDVGADLVAVGSHGYSGLRRTVLGSVSEAVIRHAPCAVLVAR